MYSSSQQENLIEVNFKQTNTIDIEEVPQIKIIEGIHQLNEQNHLQVYNKEQKEDGNNKINDNKKEILNEIVQLTKKESTNSNTNVSNKVSAITSPILMSLNQGSKSGKLKISTQNLEKLSSEEKFDLALIALNQPANQRNPIEQKLIEETIDSFAYIQKMKKRKPTLAKQVARVVEYQKCKKGQAVFYAGQQPEKFYLILRGKVAVLLKKSDSQIAMDRKNGKFINLQSILDKNSGSNIAIHQFLERTNTQDIGSGLNSPRQSTLPNHTPSQFSSNKSNNNNNSPLLQNNSNLLSNFNQMSSFANKSIVSSFNKNTSQLVNKQINGRVLNGQVYNERGSDSASSSENPTTPHDLVTQVNQIHREETKLFVEQNTPIQLNNISKLSLNWQKSAVQFQKNNASRVDSKQSEYISKFINLTPDELEEPDKFYDNGVFRYEYAKELHQGAAFGEVGLLLRVPRTATILAVEDTDFQIIKSLENYKLEKKIQFFQNALHFDFKIDEIGKLCIDFSQKKKFIKDQHIFKDGEKSKEVLVIKSGEVELYKTITDQDGKKKKIQFSNIGPGEILGVEEIFYSKTERYYNARCMNEVKAYYINKNLFIRLMHEIPDLKQIMQKRTKNKLKWQEFKIQEIIEQQKLEGLLLDKNIYDFVLPCSENQINLQGKKKRGSITQNNQEEDQSEDKKRKQLEKQEQLISPKNIQNQGHDDYQLLKHGKSDLMAPHARKHKKSEEFNTKSLNANAAKVQDESLRGYERIEDQMKIKEHVMEMMEKNTNSLVAQLHAQQKTDKKKNAHEDAIYNHVGNLIGKQDWFDIEKKKQLEQKIADAIKLRRQTPGNNRYHMKLKQKVDTLPHVSASATSMTALNTQNSSISSLSSLPQEMQKRVMKFKKDRDRSQFNSYINSLTDIAQDDLSPNAQIGQINSIKGIKKIGRSSLSLNTNESAKQMFFPSSETYFTSPSINEIETNPYQSQSNGNSIKGLRKGNQANLSQAQINQLTQKSPVYQFKTNNSQNSFQDIAEEPILENEISQKPIHSQLKNQIFQNLKQIQNQKLFQIEKEPSNEAQQQNQIASPYQHQQQILKQQTNQSKVLVKQSTLQGLEDDFENKTPNRESLDHLDTNQVKNNHKKQNYLNQDNYFIQPRALSMKKQNNTSQNKLNSNSYQNLNQVHSIQYKSLNELEQSNTQDQSMLKSLGQKQNEINKYQSNQLYLPSLKSEGNILSEKISPNSVQNKQQFFQGGFKANNLFKKFMAEKEKGQNIITNSNKLSDKLKPEFIIKSHNISSNQLQSAQHRLSQTPIKGLSTSTTNSRSQSFLLKFSNKV